MKYLLTLIAGLLITTNVYAAADIVYDEVTNDESVKVINRVENIYISTDKLVVHEEQATVVNGVELQCKRTNTITTMADDVILVPKAVSDWLAVKYPEYTLPVAVDTSYNKYDYFMTACNIDVPAIQAVIISFKDMEAKVAEAVAALGGIEQE